MSIDSLDRFSNVNSDPSTPGAGAGQPPRPPPKDRPPLAGPPHGFRNVQYTGTSTRDALTGGGFNNGATPPPGSKDVYALNVKTPDSNTNLKYTAKAYASVLGISHSLSQNIDEMLKTIFRHAQQVEVK